MIIVVYARMNSLILTYIISKHFFMKYVQIVF